MLNVVQLSGKYGDGGENPASGTLTFTPSAVLTDGTDHVEVRQPPVIATLGQAGTFTVELYATDNVNLLPSGWGWNVTECIAGTPPYTWSFLLPYADGAEQDISDLAPVSSVITMATYLPSTGGTMTGPLTIAGTLLIPAGATAGYVWTSDADGDGSWQAVGDIAGDKNYTQDFSSASVITVTHNLGKYPSVDVLDTAGDVMVGDITNLSVNQLTVTFTAPTSGTVTCN